VVLRALVDDVICLALEPNHPDPAVLAFHQGERYELAKVQRRAARHAAVMVYVHRGTRGRRLGRELAFELLLHCKLQRRPWRTGAAGARVGGVEAAACDGGAREKPTSGGGGTRVARGRSSRATVAGQGRLRLRRRLGLGAKEECMSEWLVKRF
jgi:hypothetical protein